MFISVKAVEWVLENSQSTGNARNILLVIAAHLNFDGSAWPSFDRLVKLSRASRPTVARYISELEDLGELEVTRSEGGSNIYRLPKFLPANTSKDQLSSDHSAVNPPLPQPVNPPLPKEVLNNRSLEEEPFPLKEEDSKEVYKQLKRAYRRKTGKSVGTPGSYFEAFSELVRKKSGDTVLAAFELWVEEQDRTFLRTVRWPFAMFMKHAQELVEDYEDKKSGEADEEEESSLPKLQDWK